MTEEKKAEIQIKKYGEKINEERDKNTLQKRGLGMTHKT